MLNFEVQFVNSGDLIRESIWYFLTIETRTHWESPAKTLPGSGGISSECCKEQIIKWMEMRGKSSQRD